jgi:hypothetical protein
MRFRTRRPRIPGNGPAIRSALLATAYGLAPPWDVRPLGPARECAPVHSGRRRSPRLPQPAAAAGASARDKEGARRRRRAAMNDHHRGYRYEFLDSDSGSPSGPFADPVSLATSGVHRVRGRGPWALPERRARRLRLRRGWPRWLLTGSAMGRQCLWCRAPGSPGSGRSARGKTTAEQPCFANENHIQ